MHYCELCYLGDIVFANHCKVLPFASESTYLYLKESEEVIAIQMKGNGNFCFVFNVLVPFTRSFPAEKGLIHFDEATELVIGLVFPHDTADLIKKCPCGLWSGNDVFCWCNFGNPILVGSGKI